MSGTNGTAAKVGESTALKTRVAKLESEVAELKTLIEKMIDGMKRAAAKQIMDNPDVRAKMEDALMAKMPIPGTTDGPLDLGTL